MPSPIAVALVIFRGQIVVINGKNVPLVLIEILIKMLNQCDPATTVDPSGAFMVVGIADVHSYTTPAVGNAIFSLEATITINRVQVRHYFGWYIAIMRVGK
mmetsp:Transcript_430/g.634  ORF Transcript_430/g.634 Transcript_430/m.634 type:complete len:101 (-) Transcript_430:52-354(-)